MEVFMTRRIQSTFVILAAFTLAISAYAGETKTETTANDTANQEQKLEVRRVEDYKPAPKRILRFERMGNLEDRSG